MVHNLTVIDINTANTNNNDIMGRAAYTVNMPATLFMSAKRPTRFPRESCMASRVLLRAKVVCDAENAAESFFCIIYNNASNEVPDRDAVKYPGENYC